MRIVRSLAFNATFFAWTLMLHVVGLPALLLPWRATHALGRFWVRTSFALLRWIVGLDHQVIGSANRPPGPAIVAAKHQSAWDTLMLPLLFDCPALVIKRELLWVPLFGWYMWRAGMIAVDRRGGAAALRRMVATARHAAAAGRSIVIFPEGTRTPPGTHRPYQPGIAALYAQLGLPVVPVALNSGLFWGRRSFVKRPGTIRLELLAPIPPGLTRHEFLARLETEIEGAATRLAAAG